MQAKNIRSRIDNSNIIGLGAIAKKEKLKDPLVINSTTGMLYDDEGKLFTYSSVDKVINLLTPEEKYAYFPTGGTKLFKDEIKKWVFGTSYELIKEYSDVIPTPGGTGALANTFANFLNDNDYALLPNYMWTNYVQILDDSNKLYKTYDLFLNNSFNLNDLKNKAKEILKLKKRVLIVLNDPAQNPTGYTLKPNEIDDLVDALNDLKNDGEVILLLDAAYIDYADSYDKTRLNLSKYLRLDDEILLIIAFSASKSFGLYGLRVGAQIILSKNKDVLYDSYESCVYSARSKWSNTSSLGISLVSKILNDEKLKNDYLKELDESRLMLKRRSDLFKDLVKKYHLNILPYDAGFFSSIPLDNPKLVYENLKKKKLHLIPFDTSLRITLSSITCDEIKRMVEILKDEI